MAPRSQVRLTCASFLWRSDNKHTHLLPGSQGPAGAQAAERDSVLVKVHYTYTLALSVPLDTSVHDLKQQIGQKLGQSASVLRLR